MSQVLFERDKGIVNRENFEWNKNNFCREFKSVANASEFVEKFQELTVFDRVNQVVLVKAVDSEEVCPSPDMFTEAQNPNESETEAVSLERLETPPPAKKPKKTDVFKVGDAVESKKVGK